MPSIFRRNVLHIRITPLQISNPTSSRVLQSVFYILALWSFPTSRSTDKPNLARMPGTRSPRSTKCTDYKCPHRSWSASLIPPGSMSPPYTRRIRRNRRDSYAVNTSPLDRGRNRLSECLPDSNSRPGRSDSCSYPIRSCNSIRASRLHAGSFEANGEIKTRTDWRYLEGRVWRCLSGKSGTCV